jgi:5,10-methylenetetrahydromethanopterin reductase
MTEFGIVVEPSPGYTARLAVEIEAMGFDLLLCPDTQNLCGDVYGQLNLAAARTTRLRLGTGVTNPITRDVAVTACALASLQVESGGRAVCGIGRGDSSAAHVGRPNATTAQLRSCVEDLRTYIAGKPVQRSAVSSQLRWVAPMELPRPPAPVPIDIACTGPKTIRMAADVADRISFAVGGAPERIAWALTILEERLAETGRDRRSLSVGAYVNLICDEDEQRALNLGRTIAGLIAHFTGMKGAPVEHLPPRLRTLAIQMQTGYDMAHHAQEEGEHLIHVDDDFVDWFAICGPPAKCRERLSELVALGLDHVNVLGGSPVAHPHGERWAAMVGQSRLFAETVMPSFR